VGARRRVLCTHLSDATTLGRMPRYPAKRRASRVFARWGRKAGQSHFQADGHHNWQQLPVSPCRRTRQWRRCAGGGGGPDRRQQVIRRSTGGGCAPRRPKWIGDESCAWAFLLCSAQPT